MSIRSSFVIAAFACSGVFLSACATTGMPPPELTQAQAAYKKAESGDAARLKPAELHSAKEALDSAEEAYKASPNDKQKVTDLGYIAKRKAEYAETQASIAASMEAKAKADAETTKLQSSVVDSTSKDMKALRAEVSRPKAETPKERAGRLEDEKKAQDAMEGLRSSLSVTSETRGIVITLPSSVMFATGQSRILPGAQSQLDKVAQALSTQTDRHFTVEGHTDNQGTDLMNQILSEQRAQAVRDYLIVHGVPAANITAVGRGTTKPIADNKTVDGRAMNRRVEVIVEKP